MTRQYQAVCAILAIAGGMLIVATWAVGIITNAQGAFGITLVSIIVAGFMLIGIAGIAAVWCYYLDNSHQGSTK